METSSSVVKLNIGGVRYITSKHTLLQDGAGGSFFSGLLSGRFSAEMVDGDYYFIDRNGRYFEPILDYLRTGVWDLPHHLKPDERLVLAEAQFYNIPISPYVKLTSVFIKKTLQDIKVVPPLPSC